MDPNNNQQFKQPSLPTPAVMPEPQAGSPALPPLSSPADGAGHPSAPAHPTGSAASVAEDTDIIEPIWISRVEAVIGESIQDPRELARRLSAVKAEYVAQRYGMTLKQGIDQR